MKIEGWSFLGDPIVLQRRFSPRTWKLYLFGPLSFSIVLQVLTLSHCQPLLPKLVFAYFDQDWSDFSSVVDDQSRSNDLQHVHLFRLPDLENMKKHAENKCCNIDLRDSGSAVRGDIDYDWYVLAYTNVSTGQSNCREVDIVTNTKPDNYCFHLET